MGEESIRLTFVKIVSVKYYHICRTVAIMNREKSKWCGHLLWGLAKELDKQKIKTKNQGKKMKNTQFKISKQ